MVQVRLWPLALALILISPIAWAEGDWTNDATPPKATYSKMSPCESYCSNKMKTGDGLGAWSSCLSACKGGATPTAAPTTSSTIGSNQPKTQPNCPKPDNFCDTSKGESCYKCPLDCDCYDLQCLPGNAGATSYGCFNPCLDVEYSVYDKASGACKCRDGYEWNQERTDCESLVCPDNTHQEGFMCVCDDGYSDCDGKRDDGCETATSRDILNCGKCKAYCVRDSSCVEGDCVCDEGYVLDKNKNACLPFKCNDNNDCEPPLGENCNDCNACACDKKSVCDAPLTLYPDITDEKGCRDCGEYCKQKYGEHSYLREKTASACLCDCEGGYVFSEDLKSCQEEEKKAVIFISKDVTPYQKMWAANKLQHIREFYADQGYRVYYKVVDDISDVTDELVKNPSTKAMAYFGHGNDPQPGETTLTVPPTIEGQTATGMLESGVNSAVKYYMKMGLSVDEARKKADEKFKDGSFKLDYAYMNVCYGMNDQTLSNALLNPGGTSWGGAGKVNTVQTLNTYTKASAGQSPGGGTP